MDKRLKTLTKLNIAIWVVIVIFFSTILMYGIISGNGKGGHFLGFNLKNSQTTIQKEENITLDKCNNINLDFSSDNIIIYSTDEDDLRVVQKSNNTLSEDEKFSFSKNDTTISIEKGNSTRVFNLFQFGSYNNQLEVYIPKKYNKNLKVDISSGNIEVKDDLTLDNVTFHQTSGNINSIKSLTTNEVDLKASSGNIKAETLITKSYKIKITSGNATINSLFGSGEVSASSGNIKIDYADIGEELNASVTSGNINLNIPTNLSFEFYGKSTSGNVNTNFDVNYKNKNDNEASGKIGNGPYKKINLKTSSGNIDIYQK